MAELFALLRTEPQHVAQDILRRIRLGNDVRTVLADVTSSGAQEHDSVGEIDLSDPTINSKRVQFQRQESYEGADDKDASTNQIRNGLVDSLISPEAVLRALKPGQTVWPGVAKRWTRLTENDALVSHLIHVYYEHQQWVCDFNDHGMFLESFSGQSDSDFCSELLVNAILANACVSITISTSLGARTRY